MNVISSPLLDPTGSVLQRLRFKRRDWLRLRRSVVFGLEEPDGRVLRHGDSLEQRARDQHLCRIWKFDRAGPEVDEAGEARAAPERDDLVAVLEPLQLRVGSPG